MKIALLTNGIFPYDTGGIQKHSLYLARNFARMGTSLDLYYSLPPDVDVSDYPRTWFSPREQSLISAVRIERSSSMYFPGHFLKTSYATSGKMYDAVREHPGTDFILAQGFMGWKLIREKLKGDALPPIGVHPHGLNMFQRTATIPSFLKKCMLRPFMKWNVAHADYAFALGESLAELLHSLGIPREQILLSPNGIERDWLAEDTDVTSTRRTFLYVGRFERIKGVPELHKAIRWISREGYDFEIDFVGPIPEGDRMNHPRATYWGLVKDEERLKALYRESDVLVCPSHSEGMPTVILEAMASGRAVIATDVGAVSEMVGAENGWLIPPADPQALGLALVEAIECSDEELEVLGSNSLAKVKKRFLWERSARTTLQEITRVLSKRRPVRSETGPDRSTETNPR